MRHRRTEETDRWADEQDWFYRIPSAKMEVWCFLEIQEYKFSEIIWLDCEPYGKNQYKKKEYNQRSSVKKSSRTMIFSKFP